MAKSLQRFLLERLNPLEAPDFPEGEGPAYRLMDAIRDGAAPTQVMLEAAADWTRNGPGDLIGLLQELCGLDLRMAVWAAMTRTEINGIIIDSFARGGHKLPVTSNTYSGLMMGLRGLPDQGFLTAMPSSQKEHMAGRLVSFPYEKYTPVYPIAACWVKGFTGLSRLRELRKWLTQFDPEDLPSTEGALDQALHRNEKVTLWAVRSGPSTLASLIEAFDTTVRLRYGRQYNEAGECYE